jgi:hypothetical protein
MRHLRAIDYQGTISLEIMNPQIWAISVRQVAEACFSVARRCVIPS